MIHSLRTILTVLAVAAAAPATPPSADPATLLDGYWAGGSTLFPDNAPFVQARFDVHGGRIGGDFSAAGWNAARRAIADVRFDGERLHFEFPSAAGSPFVVDATLRGGQLVGTVRRGSSVGPLHLLRAAPRTMAALDSVVGSYEVEPGHTQLVTWGAFGHLRLVSVADAYGDQLVPAPDGTYLMGRSIARDTVPDERLAFTRDARGAVTGFTLHRAGAPDVVARRVAGWRQERVRFRNGAVELAGTLLTPATPLRHSAVVLVHGSQDRGRDDAYDFSAAAFYLERGIAALLYDKRGVGQSTGDWHVASFEELADDALAGVRLLQRRADVNPRQVGLQGVSQGGWIAPLAAARARDVAFVVTISAAGVPPAEQVRHDQMRQIRADSLVPPAQYDSADAFIRLLYRALGDRTARRTFDAALPHALAQRWARYTIAGIPATSWIWESSRRTSSFDPLPVLRRVRCPVLLLFGEADPNYPAPVSARLMQQALRDGGNRDVTSWIAPGANHSLRVRQPDGTWVPAPGLTDVQHRWILDHLDVDF